VQGQVPLADLSRTAGNSTESSAQQEPRRLRVGWPSLERRSHHWCRSMTLWVPTGLIVAPICLLRRLQPRSYGTQRVGVQPTRPASTSTEYILTPTSPSGLGDLRGDPIFKENRMLQANFFTHTIAKPSPSRCAWRCELSRESHFWPRYDHLKSSFGQ